MRGDVGLAEAQAKLVAELSGAEPSLPGFDDERLRAMSGTLRLKRRRGVARGCPAIGRILGPRFAPWFDEYASSTYLEAGGSVEDALRFLRWLRHRNRMSAELRSLAWRLRVRRALRGIWS